MAGSTARIGSGIAAAVLLAGMPAVAVAQGGYGAVPNVPLATGQSWTGRNWTGPEDGPDMRRLPVDDRRDDAGPPRRDRPLPPLRTAGPAPVQFDGRYVRPYRGWTLPTYFATPAFHVRDFRTWDLAPPGPGRTWVRYYDDALLVGPGGRVDDVRYAIDWDRTGPPPMTMADRGPGPLRGGMHHPMPDRAYDSGYDDGYADGRDDGPGYPSTDRGAVVRYGGYAPGTVIVTTTPGTITTTTTTEEVVYAGAARRWKPAARKTWSAPSRRWSK